MRSKGLLGALALTSAAMIAAPAAQAQDSWTGPDKQRHFSISIAAGSVGLWAARDIFGAGEYAPLMGAFLGQMPGLLRELYQGRNGNFSGRDHAFNVAGALVGAYMGKDLVFRPTVNQAGRTDGIVIHYRIQF